MSGKQMLRFYEVWTKKESRIKWEGKGLYIPLSSFSVLKSTEIEGIYCNTVFYDEAAICHVCSNKKGKPSVRVINTNMLMKCIMDLEI